MKLILSRSNEADTHKQSQQQLLMILLIFINANITLNSDNSMIFSNTGNLL